MSKKAQMEEILGLAVIVILITLAGLFVVRFIVLKPAEIRNDYTMKTLAIDTITAMLRTNTKCYGESIKDLLMDCAQSGNEGNIRCYSNIYSCAYVNESIVNILNKTLNKWNRNYIFNASAACEIYFSNGNCTEAKAIEPGIQPLPANNLKVRLDVCE